MFRFILLPLLVLICTVIVEQNNDAEKTLVCQWGRNSVGPANLLPKTICSRTEHH